MKFVTLILAVYVHGSLVTIPKQYYTPKRIKRGRITGGKKLRRDVPFYARLKETPSGPVKCGGSLIDARHILTSAQCTKNKWALVGDLDEPVAIDSCRAHYNAKKLKNNQWRDDVAVCRLDQKLTFRSGYLEPVLIGSLDEWNNVVAKRRAKMCVAIGAGKIDIGKNNDGTVTYIKLRPYKKLMKFCQKNSYPLANKKMQSICIGDTGTSYFCAISTVKSPLKVKLFGIATWTLPKCKGPSGWFFPHQYKKWITRNSEYEDSYWDKTITTTTKKTTTTTTTTTTKATTTTFADSDPMKQIWKDMNGKQNALGFDKMKRRGKKCDRGWLSFKTTSKALFPNICLKDFGLTTLMNESESCKSRDAHMMAPNNVVIFTSKEILTYAQELYKNTLVGFRSSETEMPWEELIWIGIVWDYDKEAYVSAGSLTVDTMCGKFKRQVCENKKGDIPANWKRSEPEFKRSFNAARETTHRAVMDRTTKWLMPTHRQKARLICYRY